MTRCTLRGAFRYILLAGLAGCSSNGGSSGTSSGTPLAVPFVVKDEGSQSVPTLIRPTGAAVAQTARIEGVYHSPVHPHGVCPPGGGCSGMFLPPVRYPTGSRPAPIVAADFDGDGILDLATGNGTGGTVSVLHGVQTS